MAGVVSFQWRKNGTSLVNGGTVGGATTATLTFTGVAASDLGNYDVVITRTLNGVLAVTTSSNAVLTVNNPATITSQPVSAVTVVGGNTLSLHVVAEAASGTLSYQWRRDGSDISGATSASYIKTNAALADTGTYTVVVTNTLNGTSSSVTSGNAAVSVNMAPTLTTQPASTTAVAGSAASLTVVAAPGVGSMAGTLGYQWRKNGADMVNGGTVGGVTSATLTFTSVASTDLGNYEVVVTRTLNGVTAATTSNNAVLTVNNPASITSQPVSATTVVGGNAFSLSVVAEAPSGTLSYQWRRNGSDISGATGATYSKTNAALADTGTYMVSLSPMAKARLSIRSMSPASPSAKT
jgi:hypothetical protein